MNSSRKIAALQYAALGIKVFPCLPNSKKPATKNGLYDASCDPAQIEAWWEEADYNLALCPEDAGWTVVDLDGGPIGEATWAKVQAEHGEADPTYEIRTPKGGRHLYYEGSARSTVQKLGQKVDTRGVGGYVLLPPSVTPDGAYEAVNRLPVAPLPDWVAPTLNAKVEKHKSATHELDLPANIRKAVVFLQAREEVTQGNGADSKTYEAACWLHDLGLSEEKSLELMLEHYKCSPQDDRYEAFLARKIENAAAYMQNEEGAWADAGSTEDAFATSLLNLGLIGNDVEDLSQDSGQEPERFHIYTLSEMRQRPPVQYMLPDVLRERGMAMLYGQSQSMKSFLGLDMALTLASGIEGWGRPAGPPKTVVYIAAEAPEDMGIGRSRAWQSAHGVSDEVLDQNFFLLDDVPQARTPEDVKALCDKLMASDIKPQMLVIDTLAYFMVGMDENSAKDASLAFECLLAVQKYFQCLVMVVHHMGKSGRDARGSSAFGAGFDTTMELKRIESTDALELWIRKQKSSRPLTHPLTFQARELAGSVVLFPTTGEQHRKLAKQSGFIDADKIAKVLHNFGEPVTAFVIADSLLPHSDVQSAEQRALEIDRIGKAIEKTASSTLAAYMVQTEDGLRFKL